MKTNSSPNGSGTAWQALLACAVLAAPALSRADSPEPDARRLGITEGILTYCSKVDPASVPKYRERIQLLTQGANDATLAKVRSSEAYLKARQSIDDFVGKVDEHNAKRVCTNGLADHR